jgi:hypothetical protein
MFFFFSCGNPSSSCTALSIRIVASLKPLFRCIPCAQHKRAIAVAKATGWTWGWSSFSTSTCERRYARRLSCTSCATHLSFAAATGITRPRCPPPARILLPLLSGRSQRVQALVFDRVAAELFGASALQVLVLLFLRPEAATALSSCIEGQLFSCRCVSDVDTFSCRVCAFTTTAVCCSRHNQQPEKQPGNG